MQMMFSMPSLCYVPKSFFSHKYDQKNLIVREKKLVLHTTFKEHTQLQETFRTKHNHFFKLYIYVHQFAHTYALNKAMCETNHDINAYIKVKNITLGVGSRGKMSAFHLSRI